VAGRNHGLVFGDIAALQDESADGKQEQEDKREVEFGAAELADHASTYSATSSPSPRNLITEFRVIAVLMSKLDRWEAEHGLNPLLNCDRYILMPRTFQITGDAMDGGAGWN
jgi:hypothetical protein